MEQVVFVHCEKTDDDIIISLSCREGGHFGVEGFIIQRSPEYEACLPPHEQGASIDWDEKDDIRVLLDRVHCTRNVIVFETRGKYQNHKFDISKISDEDFKKLIKFLKHINFDNIFSLTVA